MLRKIFAENIEFRFIAISLILMLSVLYGTFVQANEQIDTDTSINSNYIEIEVVNDIDTIDNEAEFFYANSSITDYEAGSLNSRDILRTIPSINTKDNKILGLVMPPFAYFKTTF